MPSKRLLNSSIKAHALDAVIELYQEMSDVLFWIKDADLRIVALNQAFADRVNRPRTEILGRTDADLYPAELAAVFMNDDREVMRNSAPLVRKVELLATRHGGIEWRITTKLPIADRRGQVVGTTGVSRPVDNAGVDLPQPYRAFAGIVEHARQHLRDGVQVSDLARHAAMSVSSLERRFREHLRLSPGEFLLQLKVAHACKRLADGPMSIGDIAYDCGFQDQAAFSRFFRSRMGVSPSDYRRRPDQAPHSRRTSR